MEEEEEEEGLGRKKSKHILMMGCTDQRENEMKQRRDQGRKKKHTRE